MRKDDAELLKKLIGKKVVEVRVDLNDHMTTVLT